MDDDQDDIDTDPGMGPRIRLDLTDADIDDFVDGWERGLDALDWNGATDEEGKPVKVKPKLSVREQRILDGVCPECGDVGDWINLAAVCPKHGRFMG